MHVCINKTVMQRGNQHSAHDSQPSFRTNISPLNPLSLTVNHIFITGQVQIIHHSLN